MTAERSSKRNVNNSLRQLSMGRFACLLGTFTIAMLVLVAGGSVSAAGAADLQIAKSASAASVNVGSTLTYTIQVQNLGPEAATGVTVTDHLPPGVDYVSASSTLGQCALQGRKLTCGIGGLEAGSTAKVNSAAVTLSVIPRRSGTITNMASVKGDQKDPVSANNEASITILVVGGTPTPTCRGVPATIAGTAGADNLAGTAGRDVIVALGGNDTIAALAGQDLVCAGGGSDFVGAGSSADRVFGGAGKDRLLGRDGVAVLRGSAGSDVLKGGQGSDRLRGGRGFDLCRGGPDFDFIRGCER